MVRKSFVAAVLGLATVLAPVTAAQASATTQGDVGAAAVTVTYTVSGAPSFRSQISTSISHWNSSVTNVRLQQVSSGGNFSFREGNDPRGSYASTNGHGSGYVFIDYAQVRQYDVIRVITHETGHILGLPDHYSGPCSELMSGGGPGTSCTNSYPNSTERSRVNSLWANGLASTSTAQTTITEPQIFAKG
jgi:snapalysin